jgi:hypothetical protein
MNSDLFEKLAILGVVVFVSPACQKSNPARPSFTTLPTAASQNVSVALTGLKGSFVGMGDELCDGGAPVAIDDLTVNYEVSGKSLAGAVLVACENDSCEGSTPLGTIGECPLPPTPCEAGLPPAVSEGRAACLIGDPLGAGSVHVYAARPLDAEASWQVTAIFADTGDRTNTVSGAVDLAKDIVVPDSSMDSARFTRKLNR